MQWLDNFVRKTKCYGRLFRELSLCKKEHEKLEFMYEKQHKHLVEKNNDIDKLTKQILTNKTIARRIIRLTNSLLKKDELVCAKKDIQSLCREIIKGE